MSHERTILIVDDNVNLVLGFAKLLRNAGYGVYTAYAAADGLRLALLHRPDAIILDFRMPLINGVGFLYRLRELTDHRHTPVMVVTGVTISDEQRAEFSDLHAIVQFKPISVKDFLIETARMVSGPHSKAVAEPGVESFVR
ncbi:MAG TPA: response regulator [Vicinamibacterales bacterium]|nr:response regulator [Vicinamibacterales bacterium]